MPICASDHMGENASNKISSQSFIGASSAWFNPCVVGEVLSFSSEFSGRLYFFPDEGGQSLQIGSDVRRKDCDNGESDWHLGNAAIQFQGGTDDDRDVEVVQDPLNSSNKVLSFVLRRANVSGHLSRPYKGRVQMNIYDSAGITNLDFTIGLYLPHVLEKLNYFKGEIDWFSISEWWNNAGWTGQPYPFRISVNLVKSKLDENLYFAVKAQTKLVEEGVWDKPIWSQVNKDYPVPLGRWITLHYTLVEGDQEDGQFSLHLSSEEQPPISIFDIHNFTHHPLDPNPDGFSNMNPLKLYTSRELIEYMQRSQGYFQILWDDFSIKAF